MSRDLQEKESDCAQHVSKAIWFFGKNRWVLASNSYVNYPSLESFLGRYSRSWVTGFVWRNPEIQILVHFHEVFSSFLWDPVSSFLHKQSIYELVMWMLFLCQQDGKFMVGCAGYPNVRLFTKSFHDSCCLHVLVCFLSSLVWFCLWLPEEVLTLLFLVHHENGDFSILMKDIVTFMSALFELLLEQTKTME